MGAFADTLVIIMLVLAAAAFVVLLVAALVELARSPYSVYAKLGWLLLLLATGPIGMIVWFSVGFRSPRRDHDIEYQRRWRRTNQVDTTVDIEELADASR